MSLSDAQRRELRLQCQLTLPDFAVSAAAEDFRAVAHWCETNRIEHDEYGEGALVEGFEAKVGTLLGKPAAVFMPSGMMAQLAAVRVWTDRARIPRFGMHPTSHLANTRKRRTWRSCASAAYQSVIGYGHGRAARCGTAGAERSESARQPAVAEERTALTTS